MFAQYSPVRNLLSRLRPAFPCHSQTFERERAHQEKTNLNLRSANSRSRVFNMLGAPFRKKKPGAGVTAKLTQPHLTELESTLTQNRPATLLQSTLTKTLDLKSSRINTYKKTGGRGVREPKSPVRGASAVREVAVAVPPPRRSPRPTGLGKRRSWSESPLWSQSRR